MKSEDTETCICSKIMETIIKDQLMYYLIDNKLISRPLGTSMAFFHATQLVLNFWNVLTIGQLL